ncbi:MAG TPA: hypothetical protein VFD58_24665 [Blastocatellia bacterium]|nr:hypothetical protein [Blastocatellia bacterium]
MSIFTTSSPATRKAPLSLVLLSALFLLVVPVRAGDANYYSLEQLSPLPPSLSSLLVQSPILIDVPAGAMLSVTLMKGETVITTSSLKFTAKYSNSRLIPPVPVASFYPTGSNIAPGQPLPDSTLTPGYADLDAVAAAPGQYKLLWIVSDGVIASPSRAIATSPTSPLNLIDLKLAAVSAAIRPGDQKPGSVLFYPRYTSSASNPAREDSSLSLSNTSPTDSTYVRLFLINNSCQPLEYTLCLSARRTVSVLLSDLDPGSRGYVIAVACDAAGQPTQFNWLTGAVSVKQPNPVNGTPYDLALGAVAVAKRSGGAVTPASGKSEMAFDDAMYDRLPGQIAADDVQSQASGANNTTLMVFRPLPDLAGGSPSATFRLTAFNSDGNTGSADVNAANACYRDIALPTLRTTPRINDLIPPGTNAWFSIATTDATPQPVLGAQFNYGKFSGGNTARPLTYANDYRITIPVVALTCPN